MVPLEEGDFYYETELGSSNDRAAELVKGGAGSGTLVLAESQTSGRGRGGNVWRCPAGEGLLFSMVLEPDIERAQWSRLALAAGLAVSDALIELGLDAGVKWPNDVYVGGRKVAGVLVEGCDDAVVVGVGVNISVVEFPEGMEATSLVLEGLSCVSREDLLARIIDGLLRWGSRCGGGFEGVVAAVNERCVFKHEEVEVWIHGVRRVGKLLGVSGEGFLLLEGEAGLEKVAQADGLRLLG